MSSAGNDSGALNCIVCSEGLELRHQMTVTIRATSKAQEMSHDKVSRVLLAGVNDGVPVCPPLSAIHFNSAPRSHADCHLSSGSLARQRLTMRSSEGGDDGASSLIGLGSTDRIAAIKLALVFPVNAGSPVAIS